MTGPDLAQDCAQCDQPIDQGDEHYPDPDDCQPHNPGPCWTTGTAPVHPDCCPNCNEAVPW